ncbi:MAG: DMT family transporter [Chloroflexota bacterium]
MARSLRTTDIQPAGDGGSPSMMERASAVPWQARLVLLGAIWGMSFLFIKVGDEALAPLQVALARLIFGTATLLAILAVRREALPRDRTLWAHLAVAALLFNVLPFSLFAYGETLTTSVLAGILNATTPLLTLPIAMLTLPEERPTRNRILGLIVGFTGVLVVFGIWHVTGGHALLGNLACLAAAACYGVGFPYLRKHIAGRPESSVVLSAAQLLCATVELALVVPFLTKAPTTLPVKVLASVVALGVLGTGIAYVLNYGLIRDAGATNASTVTYVIPLFATLAGVLFLQEHLTWNEPAGAVVVIAGVALTQDRFRIARRRQ